MRTKQKIIYSFLTIMLFQVSSIFGHTCPDDHISVGCNPDGVWAEGDEPNDDRQLWIDFHDLYRHTDPNHLEEAAWLYRYYPLNKSVIPYEYRYNRGEPGFEQMWYELYPGGPIVNQEHKLAGVPKVDYELWVKCVDLSPNCYAVEREAGDFMIDEAEEEFNLSDWPEHHVHMRFRALTQHDLYWFTFLVYDKKGGYLPTAPFTIVFGREPPEGDIRVDGQVDLRDLYRLHDRWLDSIDPNTAEVMQEQARRCDYLQRADINEDYKVNLIDLGKMCLNWLLDLW